MSLKKAPERMCLACRERKQKKELIRIVKNNDSFSIDYSNKLDGRGAYICRNKDCIDRCVKHKMLNKTFKCEIPNDVYQVIKEISFEE